MFVVNFYLEINSLNREHNILFAKLIFLIIYPLKLSFLSSQISNTIF